MRNQSNLYTGHLFDLWVCLFGVTCSSVFTSDCMGSHKELGLTELLQKDFPLTKKVSNIWVESRRRPRVEVMLQPEHIQATLHLPKEPAKYNRT